MSKISYVDSYRNLGQRVSFVMFVDLKFYKMFRVLFDWSLETHPRRIEHPSRDGQFHMGAPAGNFWSLSSYKGQGARNFKRKLK